MATTVREVMTPDPICLEPRTTLTEAARQMRESDIGDILIVDNESLRGIVTDRDITIRAVADGRDPNATTLDEIASDEVLTVNADDPVSRAVSLMRENALRRLPVCDGDRPIGIVSIGDLAIEQDRGSALADISAAAANR